MRSAALILAVALCSSPAGAGPYNDAGPAVIHIHIEGLYKAPPTNTKSKDYHDDATGFVVSPDGLVLTAGHVVPNPNDFEDPPTVEGRLPQSVAKGFSAEDPPLKLSIVKSTVTPYDVGMFKIEGITQPLKYLRLCDEYEVGEEISLLGYLVGKHVLTQRLGYVAAPGIDPDPMVMQIPMSPGDSGSPVFNKKGSVFAIGIGQLTLNGERVEMTNLAVLVHNAIGAMSPEAKALIGKSYDPECGKTLIDEPSGPSEQVRLDQKTGVSLDPGQSTTLTHTFNAPNGKVISEILHSDAASTSASISVKPSGPTIAEGGRVARMDVEARERGSETGLPWVLNSLGLGRPSSAQVQGSVVATVKPSPTSPVVASSAPEPLVRSFLVSKDLDTHAELPTRESYTNQIPAPRGYRFQQILGVNVASQSHVTSGTPEASVLEDGNRIQVTFSLESGPLSNPWKAWIDAFLTARMVPLPR